MAQIKISNHAGTEFASIINNPAGSIYADQIYWGNGSYFVTEDNTFSTTEELLAAINAKINDAKNNGGLSSEEVNSLISSYVTTNKLTSETKVNTLISSYATTNKLTSETKVNELVSSYVTTNSIASESKVNELVSYYSTSHNLTSETRVGELMSTYVNNYYNSYLAEKIADNKISDEDVSSKISAYLQNNNVIPSLSKADTYPGAGYYIYDVQVNGHAITPLWKTIPQYTHPSAADMWGTFTE